MEGGKFTYEVLEKTHVACGALGEWLINWHEASKIYVKIRAILEER